MLNLEEILRDKREVDGQWIELRPHPAEPPLGRARVTVSALRALQLVQAEVEEDPQSARPHLPDEIERSRVDLEQALMAP